MDCSICTFGDIKSTVENDLPQPGVKDPGMESGINFIIV